MRLPTSGPARCLRSPTLGTAEETPSRSCCLTGPGCWRHCCAAIRGNSSFPLYFYFNESTLNFTTEATATSGKFDDFDEEGWILLAQRE